MKKYAIIFGIALIVIGMITVGEPLDSSDDVKSIAKKKINNIQMDTLKDSVTQVTNEIGEKAIETSCNNSNPQFCNNARFAVFTTSLAIGVLFVGLFVSGIVIAVKATMNLF